MLFKRSRAIFLPLTLLVLAALACSFNPFGDGSDSGPASEAQVLPTLQPTAQPAQAPAQAANAPIVNQQTVTTLDLEDKLIDLYERVNPAVVHILVYSSLDDFAPLGSGSGFTAALQSG